MVRGRSGLAGGLPGGELVLVAQALQPLHMG